MDDSEKIRQKRLAKLAASASSPTASSSTDTNASQEERGFLPQQSEHVPIKLDRGPEVNAVTTPPKKSPTSPAASRLRIVESFLQQADDDWQNEAFEQIFECTLNPDERKVLTALPDLVEEFNAESIPLKFTTAQLERVLYARLSLEQNASASSPPLFDYLVETWKRIQRVRSHISSVVEKGSSNPSVGEVARRRLEFLDTAQRLVVSYSGLVINPEMAGSFPQPPSTAELGPSYIAKKLLLTADEVESALPRAFLEDFVNHFSGEGLDEMMGYVVTSLAANMREQSLIKDYQAPLRALGMLVSFKPIAAVVPMLKNWNPETTAKTIEILTILGPFLSKISSFPDADPALADHYFGSSNAFAEGGASLDGFYIGSRNPGDVRSSMESLRNITALAQSNLYNITMNIIKAGPDSRERVLQYLSSAIAVNKRRGRMQVNMRDVSTDGFMYNLLQVALKLSDPIIDAKYSKLHLIDPDYFNHSKRLDVTEDTRINADKETCERYVKQWHETHPNPEPTNFVSDIFYLTLGLHHYGLMSIIRQYTTLIKQTQELAKHVEKMKAERDSGAWPGPARMLNEEMLKRFQKQLDKLIGYKLAMDTALRNRVAIEHSLRFYDLVMMWLLRSTVIGSPQVHYPLTTKAGDSVDWGRVARGDLMGLPLLGLSGDAPLSFGTLPEWIIEDICEFYLFIVRYDAPIFERNPRDEFLTFTMIFLANPQLIKNPHLKSKFVEILFTFTWPLWRTESGQTGGKLDDVFSTHPLAKELLVPNLMRFYVDVEHTGVSSQFYDKFNIRYNISQILKSVWADAGHRSKMVSQSRNTEFFVRFVALLMNDTTYLLDESLSKLKQIQQLQIELADPLSPAASREDLQRREERSGFLRQLEGQAHSYMSLGNETVHMLQYMTANSEIVQPFMEPEIVERLAAMLDFNLAALVGPRCTELKVKNPEKYRFEPKRLLRELVDIYLHLAHRQEFISAVAKDERSYRKDLFSRAAGILLKNMLKNESELSKLQQFIDRVEATIQSSQAEEEELGDVPEEFLDPLLYTLMEDPVILPGSGISIDRSTIKSHLLSDAHDPFNRQPLSIEQVIPNDELKMRIQEWKGERRRDVGRVQPMDTS
ncbi:hypothetical protein, variant [Spizellomyces punctatus DAOM BR117]|uniref:RING-type E3 ubiquitin transferase n=1 Tax=Spizellomyces punctatus (strain DAOM BR117) TaxID=645134 RepID=A0A0L0HUH5_SPIPD|nr:hypothetical protein, variant [Spizellomyces punctatus DAOM BR117]KND04737.1 hypothetical protein, variant [Spizellomyces punctatus DAOM BR117]|eukprot:XP_016612776.1 hypothetical protein, variant [Spizellomyces punctatus DAOM BR117]